MNTKNKFKTKFGLGSSAPVLVFGLSALFPIEPSAMVEMQDEQLSAVTGQALLQMGKEQGTGASSDINFYKAGLDAEIALNLNIEKLQLGCTSGTINGNHCDIDIDNLSLSGGTWGPDGRPSSAALLTRPFFEFAIKNDQSKTLREVVGIRMSAEQAQGLLTAGDQQAGSSDPGNLSGINSLSGYMKLGATSGNATVASRPMTYDDYTCTASDPCTGTYAGLGRNMEGRIKLDGTIILDGVRDFFSDSYALQVTTDDPAVVTVPVTEISGRRMSSVNLLGSATLGELEFYGNMTADIGIALDKNVTGSISGLTATVPIEQSLKFIHKISVDGGFALSMQKESVLWPGASGHRS